MGYEIIVPLASLLGLLLCIAIGSALANGNELDIVWIIPVAPIAGTLVLWWPMWMLMRATGS